MNFETQPKKLRAWLIERTLQTRDWHRPKRQKTFGYSISRNRGNSYILLYFCSYFIRVSVNRTCTVAARFASYLQNTVWATITKYMYSDVGLRLVNAILQSVTGSQHPGIVCQQWLNIFNPFAFLQNSCVMSIYST